MNLSSYLWMGVAIAVAAATPLLLAKKGPLKGREWYVVAVVLLSIVILWPVVAMVAVHDHFEE